MDSHTLHAFAGFLLLALFGALMFWLASWVSNRRMLSTADDEDQAQPAEVASLIHPFADAPGEADGESWRDE